MSGIESDTIHIIMLIVAIFFTVVAIIDKNPYDNGTPEHLGMRMFRTGLALVFWSYGFGLIGVLLFFVTLIMAVVVMSKGLVAAGVQLIIAGILVRIVDLASWRAWMSGF